MPFGAPRGYSLAVANPYEDRRARTAQCRGYDLAKEPTRFGERRRETVAQSRIMRLLVIWPPLSGFCYGPCSWAWAMPFAAMMSRPPIVITEDLA
jgi:hypothetical protein